MSSTNNPRQYGGEHVLDAQTGRLSSKQLNKDIFLYGVIKDLNYDPPSDLITVDWQPLSEYREGDATTATAVMLPYGKLLTDTNKYGSSNMLQLKSLVLNNIKIFYKIPDGSDTLNFDPISGWICYIQLHQLLTRRYFFP